MAQQVDMMDALIGKRTAVMGESAAPRRQIIVSLRTTPTHPNRHNAYLTQFAGFDGMLDALNRLVVTVLKHRKYLETVGFGQVIGLMQLPRMHKSRLFDQDVFPIV